MRQNLSICVFSMSATCGTRVHEWNVLKWSAWCAWRGAARRAPDLGAAQAGHGRAAPAVQPGGGPRGGRAAGRPLHAERGGPDARARRRPGGLHAAGAVGARGAAAAPAVPHRLLPRLCRRARVPLLAQGARAGPARGPCPPRPCTLGAVRVRDKLRLAPACQPCGWRACAACKASSGQAPASARRAGAARAQEGRRRLFARVRSAVAARALVAKPAYQAALLGVGAAAAQLRGVRLAALPAPGRLYELGEWGDLQARACCKRCRGLHLRALCKDLCMRDPVRCMSRRSSLCACTDVCHTCGKYTSSSKSPLPTEGWGCRAPCFAVHGECMHGKAALEAT